MFQIRDILVRIRVLGSVPLTHGFGCGSERPKAKKWKKYTDPPDPEHWMALNRILTNGKMVCEEDVLQGKSGL